MTQDLGLVIAIVGSATAIVGVVIALFLWTRGEASADRRDLANMIRIAIEGMEKIIESMDKEMKDFHFRLEKQDLEHKSRMEKIEYEYKQHLIHMHKSN